MTIRNGSGAIPEQEETKLTEPRPWPNDMKDYRDQSAERDAKAMKLLKPLLTHSDPAVVRVAALAIDEMSNAIRWLELAGAPTRPERL
jgi:hypothetical protein